MIFVGIDVFSQQISLKPTAAKGLTNVGRMDISPLSSQFYTFKPIPANFYVKNLGFFCKQELKFENATKIPFKFRLGSVGYCDWMEGKKNAGIRPAY